MDNFTRKKVGELELAVAKQFGAENVSQTFSITPQKAQKIIAQARLENSFLNRINVVMVKNQQGEALALDATGMIAGTTDTNAQDRAPKDPHSKGGTDYHCQQVNFDTLIRYETLDAWAHDKKFKTLVAVQTRKQISTNQIQIGFYGTSRAATSNPVDNPKGEDVAVGWLKKLEIQNPENFLVEGKTTGQIRIGTGGDYVNLDAAVNDVKQMIDPVYEDDGDLVAIIGSELLAAEKAKFYAQHGNTPSEKSKIEDRQIIGTYGGLDAYKVPNFPGRGIFVTSFKNLSIYIQKDSVRRRMEDNAKRDRYETYQSQNMDYVIEELGKAALLNYKNVKLSDDGGTTWA